MSLAGKVAIVVGGLGGIGFETARHLLLEGVDKLAILDVVYIQAFVEKLQDEFPKNIVFFRKTDVTDRLEVERSFAEIITKFQHIDICVNSVGSIDEKNVQNTLNVNFIGVVNCTQVAVEHMSFEKGGKGGWIVNVASVIGLDGFFASPIFAASKHAVIGFTRSLADPFYSKIYGIKFITICPGVTHTPLISNLTDLLYRSDVEEHAIEALSTMNVQSSEQCGKILVEILPNAENGSIWIVDNGNAKEVVLKNHWLHN